MRIGCSFGYTRTSRCRRSMAEQRLQKVLASAGVDSRRNCEELILEGAVRVNGRVVDTLPAFVDADRDVITVDGKRIRAARKAYFLLNKPKGVICTNSDPQGRVRAIDLVRTDERVFCVGRLDADTTGLIIITNDSELTNKLTHPRYELPRTYVVRVEGQISGGAAEKLKKGVWLTEGKARHAAVKILKRDWKGSLIEVTLRQGLNRQVRRMLLAAGLRVKSVKRTKIGSLTAEGLGVGKFRTLSEAEVKYLRKATN